jgi:hypothetical protein
VYIATDADAKVAEETVVVEMEGIWYEEVVASIVVACFPSSNRHGMGK